MISLSYEAGGTVMKYAIIGDLHSAIDETKAVLKDIKKLGLDQQIIGLGDLFECKISKRKVALLTEKLPIKEAAVYNKPFVELLTFPSVIGNQEERIALVTGDEQFLKYPSTIQLEHATIVHGHQFDYTEEDFELLTPSFESKILFFGHSHRSALYINDVRNKIEFDKPYSLAQYNQIIVNVGSVVDNLEWCIYDSDTLTVTFKKSTLNKTSDVL